MQKSGPEQSTLQDSLLFAKQFPQPSPNRTHDESRDLHTTGVYSPAKPFGESRILDSILETPGAAQPPTLRDSLAQLERSLQHTTQSKSVNSLPSFRPGSEAKTAVPLDTEEALSIELNHGSVLRWCPSCGRESVAEVSYHNSSKTFWSAVGIFFLGGVVGCCVLPYCFNQCKQTKFACTGCGKMI